SCGMAIEPGGVAVDGHHLFADRAVLRIVAALGPGAAGSRNLLFLCNVDFRNPLLAGTWWPGEGQSASARKIACSLTPKHSRPWSLAKITKLLVPCITFCYSYEVRTRALSRSQGRAPEADMSVHGQGNIGKITVPELLQRKSQAANSPNK